MKAEDALPQSGESPGNIRNTKCLITFISLEMGKLLNKKQVHIAEAAGGEISNWLSR